MRCCTASRACMFMLAVRMAAMFMRAASLQHAVGDEHQPVAHLRPGALAPGSRDRTQARTVGQPPGEAGRTSRPVAGAAGDGRR